MADGSGVGLPARRPASKAARSAARAAGRFLPTMRRRARARRRRVTSGRRPTSAPRATTLTRRSSPASRARSVQRDAQFDDVRAACLRLDQRVVDRRGGRPGRRAERTCASEGGFMTTAASARSTIGEPIGRSPMMTVQEAVPRASPGRRTGSRRSRGPRGPLPGPGPGRRRAAPGRRSRRRRRALHAQASSAAARRGGLGVPCHGPVHQHAQRIGLRDVVARCSIDFVRRHAPADRAVREDLDDGEARRLRAGPRRPADHRPARPMWRRVGDRAAGRVGDARQQGQHLGDGDGVAGEAGLAPGRAWRSCAARAASSAPSGRRSCRRCRCSRRSTLMQLAARRGVDDLGRADRGQVAVALVGEHERVGPDAPDARRHRRRATVGRLDEVELRGSRR